MFSCVRVCMYLYNWHINLNRVSRINNFSVYVLLGHVISDEIESVVFSYDGKYVATYDVYLVGTGDNIKVCTVSSGSDLHTSQGNRRMHKLHNVCLCMCVFEI